MIRFKYTANMGPVGILLVVFLLASCGRPSNTYHDSAMDFAALRSVAVMPLANLSQDRLAGARVRDTFMNKLFTTGAVYVIPSGEVARGITRIGIVDATSPAPEEVVRLAAIIKADAVITGTVREYGEVRSGSTFANIISLSLEMLEAQTGKIVWSASATKGGITTWGRLFGGGGEPMNNVTEKAINELLVKLFAVGPQEIAAQEASPAAEEETFPTEEQVE